MSRFALAAAALAIVPINESRAQTAGAAEPPMPIGICATTPRMGYASDPASGNSGFAFICGQGGAIMSEVGAEMAWLSPRQNNSSLLLVGRRGQNGVCLSITVASPGATGGVDLVSQYAFVPNVDVDRMRTGEALTLQRVANPSLLPAEAADCSGNLHDRTVDVVTFLGTRAPAGVGAERVAPPPPPQPIYNRVRADTYET